MYDVAHAAHEVVTRQKLLVVTAGEPGAEIGVPLDGLRVLPLPLCTSAPHSSVPERIPGQASCRSP